MDDSNFIPLTVKVEVTNIQFDFDDEDFTSEEQQSVVDSVLGKTFVIEVEDDKDDDEIGDVLVENITDLTGWCICSIDYLQVFT
jgi:hypothetical protein